MIFIEKVQEHMTIQTSDDATEFINYISDNYEQTKKTLQILAQQHHQPFDEDGFHECILRCHKAITKKGFLQDKSPYGITSYLVRSYLNYVNEVKRAACNAKRDHNYNSDNITELHEEYYNKHNTSERDKLLSDLFKDYSCLYILRFVEQHFDEEHFYLFRVKQLVPGMTYKKLKEKTGFKAVRQKVLEVKTFIQQHLTKEQIKEAFYQEYGNLI